MTDPILYLSMLLSLVGIYTLISSFGDDDDDSNDDDDDPIEFHPLPPRQLT